MTRVLFLLTLLTSSVVGITLSPVKLQSGAVSFSFDSATNQLISVESLDSLTTNWTDLAFYHGTGAPITFFTPATNTSRFFRLRVTDYKPLDLFPNSETLPNGSVSLPDAIAGSAYGEQISPDFTGLPPYRLQITGVPPDGISLVITNQDSSRSAFRISSSGEALIPGQRRQFSVTVIDSLNTMITRNYDLRVVAPPPTIGISSLTLKAGEMTNIALSATGGTGLLVWSSNDPLPSGVSLSSQGILTGTPTADAAERNEDGRYINTIEVTDDFTDRLTDAPAPRKATAALQTLVRLSYRHNIQAVRPDGPSFQQNCLVCHGPDFLPNLAATARELIYVKSGSGAECGTDRDYVSPGDASDSLIYEKVITRALCGERMPFNGPYLSEQQINRLARWIRELKPNDID